ncbi:Dystrobrevin alpha [Eumeta japonica]|uniref:Dystrobrevin alpha n=1 Tax=Eumeta variegata TaxID=151549 RepID=A0A4C1ZGX5_EUMVA|nr:Dystrobrevin alpha [Eumeta japonica]
MFPVQTQQSSPRSTPNSSPRSTKSPPLPGVQAQPTAPERVDTGVRGTVRSAPQTPSLGERERLDVSAMTHSLGMEGMGGDGRNFHPNQRPTNMSIDNRSLRSDLLYAADSVTNAMSTLVRELNSEGSDTEDTIKGAIGPRKQRGVVTRSTDLDEDEDSDEPMPRPQPPRHYLHDNGMQVGQSAPAARAHRPLLPAHIVPPAPPHRLTSISILLMDNGFTVPEAYILEDSPRMFFTFENNFAKETIVIEVTVSEKYSLEPVPKIYHRTSLAMYDAAYTATAAVSHAAPPSPCPQAGSWRTRREAKAQPAVARDTLRRDDSRRSISSVQVRYFVLKD